VSARYWQAAGLVITARGIPWLSSSEASTSSGQVPLPGERLATAPGTEPRPLFGEAILVVTAAGARPGHHRAGLRQRRRRAAQLLGQVVCPAALVLIGAQPVEQV
jgi:hypothetical protein